MHHSAPENWRPRSAREAHGRIALQGGSQSSATRRKRNKIRGRRQSRRGQRRRCAQAALSRFVPLCVRHPFPERSLLPSRSPPPRPWPPSPAYPHTCPVLSSPYPSPFSPWPTPSSQRQLQQLFPGREGKRAPGPGGQARNPGLHRERMGASRRGGSSGRRRSGSASWGLSSLRGCF